jgi:hypothetical protein
MDSNKNLTALKAEYPAFKDCLHLIQTGDYSIDELYDFNPFKDGDDKTHSPESTGNDEGVGLGVPIVQLDEMYKASLIVKAQVHLMIKLIQTGWIYVK